MRRYRGAQPEISEDICAENNQHLFDYHIGRERAGLLSRPAATTRSPPGGLP
jgi:hypothetical protein